MNINISRAATEITSFIKESCRKESCQSVFIGLSGGIDSSTALYLAAKSLGINHVYPVLLPYGNLSTEDTKDAWSVVKSLHIPSKNIEIIDIKPFVDSVVTYDSEMDDLRKGNVMARMRTIILFDLARKNNYLVVGTENKTEHLLGYYTRFGDEASDIEPLRNLYKSQVFELAKFLNVPEKIVQKTPSAGLWSGQTDEKEFGFTYKEADKILYLYSEKRVSKVEIQNMGFKKSLVEKIWYWIEKGEVKERLPYIYNSKS